MGSNQKKLNDYHNVGEVNKYMAHLADFEYPGTVYVAPGAIKHIKKGHKSQLNNDVLENLITVIKNIILSPDYVGHHPEKKGTGIELVKNLGDNLLVGLEVDLNDNYIYVATMYPIKPSKIDNRVYSGRLKKYVEPEQLGDIAVTK